MSNIGEFQFGTFQFASYEEAAAGGTFAFAQAQADIKAVVFAFANAQADIKVIGRGFANAQGSILRGGFAYANAQGDIKAIGRKFANAQGDIKATINSFANAQGFISILHNGFANSQSDIKAVVYGFANTNALIAGSVRVFGQSQAFVIGRNKIFAQAQGDILVTSNRVANAQAQISVGTRGYGQAQAKMLAVTGYFGQAQAFIGHFKYGQAQAFISGLNSRRTGMAQARILRSGDSGTPISPINSADVTYLVQFNGYAVPGYLQEELFDSIENIQTYNTVYVDNSTTDSLGLANKQITLREKLIGESYLDVKNQAQRAAAILNSTRRFARLYIQTVDKYYLAMTKNISFDQDASATGKILEYSVEFEAKPWQFDTITQTLTGSGTLTTPGRTIYDGGWTPTTVRVTGTDVTISGFTENGDFAGYISVSGDVTDLIVDTEASSATIAGFNRSDVILNLDYWLYVGEGITTFEVTGASDCEITWVNRWYL